MNIAKTKSESPCYAIKHGTSSSCRHTAVCHDPELHSIKIKNITNPEWPLTNLIAERIFEKIQVLIFPLKNPEQNTRLLLVCHGFLKNMGKVLHFKENQLVAPFGTPVGLSYDNEDQCAE